MSAMLYLNILSEKENLMDSVSSLLNLIDSVYLVYAQ